jgi:hypothetical protein
MHRLWIVSLVILIAAPVAAQVPINPKVIEYTVSPDHELVDDYLLGYFTAVDAPEPLQVVNIGKQACATCTYTLPLESRPTVFGSLWMAVRARAGAEVSDWSARIPFARRLGAPVILRAY